MPRLSTRNVQSNRIDRNHSRTHAVRFSVLESTCPNETSPRPHPIHHPNMIGHGGRATCGGQEAPKSPRLQDGSIPPPEEKRPESDASKPRGLYSIHFFERSHGTTGTRAGKKRSHEAAWHFRQKERLPSYTMIDCPCRLCNHLTVAATTAGIADSVSGTRLSAMYNAPGFSRGGLTTTHFIARA